jgi:hypothetical protein
MAAMEEGGNGTVLRPSATEIAFEWFHRVVAAYCLLFGLLYWIRLIGLYEGENWRFDLMPLHWQIAASTLAVLFPFAASGLWMLASWGPVVWFICAVMETVMYVGYPELFGDRRPIAYTHALIAVVYVGFRILLHLRRRRSEGLTLH